MLPHRNNQYGHNHSYNSQSNKRKCKEGDWVCVRCSNYNYSFRNLCTFVLMQATDAGSRPRTKTKTPYPYSLIKTMAKTHSLAHSSSPSILSRQKMVLPSPLSENITKNQTGSGRTGWSCGKTPGYKI